MADETSTGSSQPGAATASNAQLLLFPQVPPAPGDVALRAARHAVLGKGAAQSPERVWIPGLAPGQHIAPAL